MDKTDMKNGQKSGHNGQKGQNGQKTDKTDVNLQTK